MCTHVHSAIQTTAVRVRVSFQPGNAPLLLWVTRPDSGMWECWWEPAVCFCHQSSVTQRAPEGPSVGLRSCSRKTLDVITLVPAYERLEASSAAVIELTTPRGGMLILTQSFLTGPSEGLKHFCMWCRHAMVFFFPKKHVEFNKGQRNRRLLKVCAYHKIHKNK